MNPFVRLTRPFYLATRSPRRQQLLREMGIPFQVVDPGIPEEADPHWGPAERASLLALAKARAAARHVAEGLVLGADTLVLCEDRVLEKPRTAAEASCMLTFLGGKTHEVLTGLAIVRQPDGRTVVDCARTLVSMRPIGLEEAQRYIASGDPMDKAGAYGIQGAAGALVEGIQGCFFNVVGLPVSLLSRMLSSLEEDGGSREI